MEHPPHIDHSSAPSAEGEARSTLLDALFLRLCRLSMELACRPLTARERRTLGGLLWPEAPEMARAVAAGLLRKPHLFPEIAARDKGAEILERQARASGYVHLTHLFLALAALCHDGYLHEAGTAVKEARAVLELVIAASRNPLLAHGLDARGRSQVMIEALLHLEKARGLNSAARPGGRGGRRARRAAAQATPAAPAAKARSGRKAKTADKAQVREQLLEAMRDASKGR